MNPSRWTLVGLLTTVLVAAGAATAPISAAQTAPTFTLKTLHMGVNQNAGTVTAEVTSSTPTTLTSFGVCVRTATDGNVDYGLASNVPVSPTAPARFTATKTFATNGVFTYFACLNHAGTWRNLGSLRFATPGQTPPAAPAPVVAPTLTATSSAVASDRATLTWDYTAGSDTAAADGVRVGRDGTDTNGAGPWSTTEPLGDGSRVFSSLAPATTYQLYAELVKGGAVVGARQAVTVTTAPTPTSPVPGKTIVWDGTNFNDPAKWNVGKTSSYPGTGPTNPGDNKLDHISPASAPTGGVFTADRRADGRWDTDLVTTEYVPGGGFELKPGDSVVSRVTLHADQGTWPALWTWGRDLATGVQPGHGEVDLFEYHGDNPRLLELSNHTRGTSTYLDNLVTPGVPFDLRVDIELTTVDFYVNGTLVWSDQRGVPANWTAWPIVNISVVAGQYHPAPAAGQTHMEYRVDGYRVYRR